MPLSPCSVNGCYKTITSRHRFPNPSKDKARFEKWVRLCGNKRLVLEMTPEKIYRVCRVCSVHFVPQNFGANNNLKKGVIPSLHLPEPLETSQSPTVSQTPAVTESGGDSDDSPRSLKLKQMLQAQFKKLRAKTQDDAVPSTSRSSTVYQVESQLIPVELDEATLNIREDEPLMLGTTLPETPKKRPGRRSSLLSEINVSQVKDLTPKARYLYKRAVQLRRRDALLRSRLSLKKRLQAAQTTSEMFESGSSMDRIRKRFFQSQLENVEKKPKGRRYTLEDKVLALALYKQSGTAYRFLSQLFALPSRKTVMKLLNRIPIQPGIHNEVFTVLKAEVKNFKNPLDKHCVIMFDEMSIQPNLQPNIKEGSATGFEDFGFKRTEKIANHTQVFMLRGIRRKWKQPIYYNFVNGATKKDDLVFILKEVIRKCHSIGLNIVATICDQGTNNQSAIKKLIEETEGRYRRSGSQFFGSHFEIDSRKIIPLFDVPHLFKGLRNNLVKHLATFIEDGITKSAKWEDIYMAYQIDPYLGSLRLMPKITDSHVNPDKINKMKVSKCTQIFSHSVAAAINVFAFSGTTVMAENKELKLQKSAAHTAAFLEFLDQLFDSLNGSAFSSNPGKNLRVAITNGSPHLNFWKVAVAKLRTVKFVRQNGTTFVPPSLKNLIKTIANFEELWRTMQEIGFNYLMPRTFNQDPLENFFGRIRQRGQRNVNPTPSDFSHYYKSLLVNQLTSLQSVGANCEDDNSELFLTLQKLVSQGLPEEGEETQETFTPVPENVPSYLKPIETEALRYIAGYLFRKIGKQPCNCKNFFLKSDSASEDKEGELFIEAKEYVRGKRHLQYVNSEFLDKLKSALGIMKFIFHRDLFKKNVVEHVTNILINKISFTSCFHDIRIKTRIFNYFIKVQLFNYTTQLNRVMKGQDLRPIPNNAPKFFLFAKDIYKTTKHKKKLT